MDSKYTQGPGPNAYKLPPQVGYEGHDVSKWRNPAFSMGLKTRTKGKDVGPGPAYTVDKMTRFGTAYSPSAPFGQRTGMTDKSDGPGPGAYNPDIRNVGKVNRVGGTFGMRPDDVAKSSGPGPNAYNVKDPTLKRQPTFAMGTRNDIVQKHVGPGPNAYNPKRQDNVRSVKFGPPPRSVAARDAGPGPGAYQGEKYLKFNKKANPPKFAFGVKTTTMPYISPEDNADCQLICRK
ncbi:outer dense fiber protein 3-like [Macrosteles quadrilineatus]|uniref:outer dense fiber protein 3-like n=1 Tax=Macrosteles quadrilineatus TaxID=74068 RepID=UPI0023E2E155|nr:outer dense fiber protein 3-like [Macrosteles quadrilineatus]